MSKLMNQIKTNTGDARRRAPVLIAAVWFIMPYKDLVKIRIPRTANEMYQFA